MVLVGYNDQIKGYRCLDFIRRKIIISRDVVFDELHIGIANQWELSSSEDDIAFLLDQHTTDPTSIAIPIILFLDDQILTRNIPELQLIHDAFSNIHSLLGSPLAHQPSTFEPESPPLLPAIDSTPPTMLPNLPIKRSSCFWRQSVRVDNYVLSNILEDFDISLTKIAPLIESDNISLDQALSYLG
jgi:hypothetical protein